MRRQRDELDPDKGRGLMSSRAERELRERDDPGHPRRGLSPLVELEVVDEQVALAGDDEMKTCFCPDTHPKPPHPKEEGVTSPDGSRMADIEVDTPPVTDELSLRDSDPGDGFDLMDDTDPIDEVLNLK